METVQENHMELELVIANKLEHVYGLANKMVVHVEMRHHHNQTHVIHIPMKMIVLVIDVHGSPEQMDKQERVKINNHLKLFLLPTINIFHTTASNNTHSGTLPFNNFI